MTTAMMDDVKRMYRLTWWALMLRGLLSLAVGVFIFARPLDSVAAFALVIAFWALFLGFVDVGFGMAALVYYPTLALTFAVVWAAWWLLVTGILGIYVALQLRRLTMDWAWPMAFGVLSVLAGIFALSSPPATLAAIMGLIAGFAIVVAIVSIAGAFKLRALVHP